MRRTAKKEKVDLKKERNIDRNIRKRRVIEKENFELNLVNLEQVWD
jgi:hypothetical protein